MFISFLTSFSEPIRGGRREDASEALTGFAMIARFTALLPYFITIRHDEGLSPHEFRLEPYGVTLYPPVQARVAYSELGMYSSLSFGEAIQRLEPA
ncbi:MAG TPA: hypothetical protein VKD71_09910, partial [Gemmataceae bacterium]|nr:hypothetical protein [Gemmataceae bacterium]